MKRLIVTALVLSGMLTAQEAKKWQQKFIEVKSGSVTRLVELLRTIPNIRANGDEGMRVISLGTDSAEVMQTAEEVIKRFDRVTSYVGPGLPKNFELTIHLLLAGKELKVGDALPPDLEPVAKQLRSVFGFKDLQLLDIGFLRSRDSESGELNGTLILDPSLPSSATYSFKYGGARVMKEERGNVVQLGRVTFGMQVPTLTKENQVAYQLAGFNTSLDLREGQKVVIGKSRIGADQRSLIVVLTAKVAD